ncbi:N-acetylneuraminate synthase family protein [Candidatus Pelagibacter sp.]|uniref:N-acetylneuraminate synthase family protein n=1 Tax=Candidatus Pelagibacter sp. TaxID=2024849 RepID=UPI003F84E94D
MNKEIKTDNFIISENSPAYIIAEIGINHNGQYELAEQLIIESAKAGANAVKFQKRDANSIMIKENINPNPIGYLSKKVDDISTDQPDYGSWSYPDIRLELTENDYKKLQKVARNEGVDFFASPWDEKSLNFLIELKVPLIKIASVEIKNYQFLEKLSKSDIPLILSTGTADEKEVDTAFKLLKKNSNNIILLQCTSAYPSKFEEIDLNVINTFKKQYNCIVGFSGHEPGINVGVSAVALGAKVIEKHVTLNKNMNGTDHLASIDMTELSNLVKGIRQIEKALGNNIKQKYESEDVLVSILGKSLATKKSMSAGDILKKEDLIAKGPSTGISSQKFYEVIGKKLLKDKKADQILMPDEIE